MARETRLSPEVKPPSLIYCLFLQKVLKRGIDLSNISQFLPQAYDSLIATSPLWNLISSQRSLNVQTYHFTIWENSSAQMHWCTKLLGAVMLEQRISLSLVLRCL